MKKKRQPILEVYKYRKTLTGGPWGLEGPSWIMKNALTISS